MNIITIKTFEILQELPKWHGVTLGKQVLLESVVDRLAWCDLPHHFINTHVQYQDFSGGPVVKNPPATAETYLTPDPGSFTRLSATKSVNHNYGSLHPRARTPREARMHGGRPTAVKDGWTRDKNHNICEAQ